MKKLITLFSIMAFGLTVFASGPIEYADDRLTLNEFKSLFNRTMLDVYRLLDSGDKKQKEISEEVEELEEEVAVVGIGGIIWARDVRTGQRYNLIGGNVQYQLWEHELEKLSRANHAVLYRTMLGHLVIGGSLADDVYISIGSSTTPIYPLTIIANKPQIFIQDLAGNAGFEISSGTESWVITISSFTEIIDPAGFSTRQRHTALTFDDKLWVIGGVDRKDVWSSADNGLTWTQTTSDVSGKFFFEHTSLVFDSKMWIIAGDTLGGANEVDDVYSSTDGITWTLITSSAAFGNRSRHTSVVFNSKMWVIGGDVGSGVSKNDVWSSSDGLTWVEETSNAGWTVTPEQGATVFEGKIWVTGGQYNDDVWYSSNGKNWTKTGTLVDVFRHSMETIGNKMYILTGRNSTVIKYSKDGITWNSFSPIFEPRERYASTIKDNKIYVLGGGILVGGEVKNDVWSSNINVAVGHYEGFYSIKDMQGKTHFYISQKDTFTYINDKLSLKLDEQGRYFEDKDYGIYVSTALQVSNRLYFSSLNRYFYDTNYKIVSSTNVFIDGNLDIDKKLIFGDVPVQNLETGSTILSGDSYYVISSTSDIVMTATPTIADGTDGDFLILRNTGTYYIDIQDDAVLAGSKMFYGGSSAVIAPKDVISFLFDALIGGWVIQSHPNLQVAGANADIILVRNTSGSTIPAIKSVYASGYNVGLHRILIGLADADDPTKMPAIGITPDSIADGANGVVVISGIIEANLSAYSLYDTLYASTTAGGLTNARPSVDEIQALAIVTRAHTKGSMIVIGAGRTNDVPINFTANIIKVSSITITGANVVLTATSTYSLNSGLLDGRNYDAFVSTAGDQMSGDLDMGGSDLVISGGGNIILGNSEKITSPANENITIDPDNILYLKRGGTLAMRFDNNNIIHFKMPIDMDNNYITDIDWANSDHGSDSGLDADLLDGLHATDFSRSTDLDDVLISDNGEVLVSNTGYIMR